jgi:GTPase SAR1 family protein
MEEDEADYSYKILVLGERFVGKTSLVIRFTEDRYIPMLRDTVS